MEVESVYKEIEIDNLEDYIDENTILVTDGDYGSFRIASGSEKRSIEAIHKTSGRTKTFDKRTDFWGQTKNTVGSGSWLSDLNVERAAKGLTEFTREDFEIKDKQHVIVKDETLEKNLKGLLEKIKNQAGVNNMMLFLGKGDVFRHEYPLAKQYKFARGDALRPIKLDFCKDHLIGEHKARLVEGIETDDVISMYMNAGYQSYLKTGKFKYICAFQDKDNLQTNGININPDVVQGEKEKYKDEDGEWKERSILKHPKPLLIKPWDEYIGMITLKKGLCKATGFRLLTLHTLLGDYSCDGFSPLKTLDMKPKPRYGEKTAYKDLVKCETMVDCLELIKKKYTEWFPEGVQYTDWRGDEQDFKWYEYANLIFKCAYMLQSKEDKTNLLTLFEKYGVEYENK